MNNGIPHHLSPIQQLALVSLRTLIGWHFLYEGYYKLMLPAWSSEGVPLGAWSAAGYLKAASGPLARLFQGMIGAGWVGWIDTTVKFGLLTIGLSLILGLFTKSGCWGALLFLTLFYLLSIPLAGIPQSGNEGTYLIVNKTLIEGVAVCVLLAFDTGAIAGLDLLWANRRRRRALEQTDIELPEGSVAGSGVRTVTVAESKQNHLSQEDRERIGHESYR